MTIYFWRVNLSGVTLFVKPEKEELLSMTGDKMLTHLGVVYFWVTSVVDIGVPGKFPFGVHNGSMFTVFWSNLLSPKH